MLAIIFNNLLKYANYALLYICVRKLKNFTQHFFTTFSIVLTPLDPFYKLNSVLTFCYLEYMLPLLLFTATYSVSPILHFVAFSHVITFIFARCATLDGKSLYDFFQLFQNVCKVLDWALANWISGNIKVNKVLVISRLWKIS